MACKAWIHPDTILLILLNSFVELHPDEHGKGKNFFFKRVKHSVKTAVSYINKFEETAASIAISKGYSHVICGHIHQPQIRKISNQQGEVTYMNSGDWVENLSALEFNKGEWSIYNYHEDLHVKAYTESYRQAKSFTHKETFKNLLKEFELK